MSRSLAAKLTEAADRLSAGLPDETPLIQFLEGEVELDELDLYCVNLMRQAAQALAGQS